MSRRDLVRIIPSRPTSDGAGVQLRRSIGSSPQLRLDPFLLFDEFYSDDPRDYLGGFPDHPHRGFETVTYMLDGHMRHEDNFGNRGDLGPGDVQWMTAGRGIIHSEMPQQSDGRMRGFQLWVNLPAAEKMRPAFYRDIDAGQIPALEPAPGVRLRVVAGEVEFGGTVTMGAIHGRTTQPFYVDVHAAQGVSLELPLPSEHHAFTYLYEGTAEIGGRSLPRSCAGILSRGKAVPIVAGAEGAKLLVIAGKPIGEPVVQYGPFVMNSDEEIQQAIEDFRRGTLASTT